MFNYHVILILFEAKFIAKRPANIWNYIVRKCCKCVEIIFHFKNACVSYKIFYLKLKCAIFIQNYICKHIIYNDKCTKLPSLCHTLNNLRDNFVYCQLYVWTVTTGRLWGCYIKHTTTRYRYWNHCSFCVLRKRVI